MRGILLISHGYYAEHFKNSLKMIAGNVDDVYSVCLDEVGGPVKFTEDLEKLKPEIEKYDEVLIFADLWGGSPCNTAYQFFAENSKVELIAGMNFGMVLTAILSPDASVNDLVQTGKDAVINVREYIQSMASDEDDEE